MNWPHVHLILNHIPILGGIFAALLLAYAAWRREGVLVRLALFLFVVFALSAVVVNWTGDPTEDAVERLPGFVEELVEEHEQAATYATALSALAGALALGGLVGYRKRPLPPRWYLGLMLLVGAATGVAMARTGLLGGEIRHPEVRGEGAPDAARNAPCRDPGSGGECLRWALAVAPPRVGQR